MATEIGEEVNSFDDVKLAGQKGLRVVWVADLAEIT